MNRSEIAELVNQIYFGPQENSIISPLLAQLRKILPNSDISDLIFQDMRNLNPTQVIDEAIQRQLNHNRIA